LITIFCGVLFANKFKVINIINSAILEDIKARLRSGDRLVILKFANKEDKSKEGRGIDRENNGDKEDKSREGNKIDRENNSARIKTIRV
jgi:hypothetical protein